MQPGVGFPSHQPILKLPAQITARSGKRRHVCLHPSDRGLARHGSATSGQGRAVPARAPPLRTLRTRAPPRSQNSRSARSWAQPDFGRLGGQYVRHGCCGPPAGRRRARLPPPALRSAGGRQGLRRRPGACPALRGVRSGPAQVRAGTAASSRAGARTAAAGSAPATNQPGGRSQRRCASATSRFV